MSSEFAENWIAFRHELHRIPELAGKEVATCAAIRRALADIPGIRVLPPFLKTDTVAFIDGAAPGKNVTLRADIDALAVCENTGAEFASLTPGMMHACGHDVHCAILFGAAQMLAAKRNEFSGSVRLVFQPGEEGRAMARDLIAAGALQNPEPDFVAALHVHPGLPLGTVGVRTGAMASSCQHFRITFIGKGGHGSMPHAAHNPIPAAVAAATELQYVVNNRINSLETAVVSICTFHGGSADNVIPEECAFSGTLRAMSVEVAKELKDSLVEICNGIAALHRVKCQVDFWGEYPAVINPASGAKLAVDAAGKAALPVHELAVPEMSSEDFSFFLQNSPDGVFIRLGAGVDAPPLHNNSFLPPDELIADGVKYMTEAALLALQQ